MDTKDIVALLELLPKTILAASVLVAVAVFRKPVTERLVPSLQSAEIWGIKFDFLKSELKIIEKQRTNAMRAELGPYLTESTFAALQHRAERMKATLSQMRLIWVDDMHPSQNLRERRALAALGVFVDPVRTTDEAIDLLKQVSYQGVITNYSRTDDHGAERLLSEIGKKHPHRQTIFYAGEERPVPKGALGYAVLPDELLHLVMDLAERGRDVGGWLTRE
ncbi:hypothetical protein ACMHYB_48630 [Sorangium sp. So ce1128]